MGLTHKSQSALEYMMTYGWAILVIVIVAGVLYSLGIFSPSSSLSTTITGFSGLAVTQAGCVNSVNNQILELYVTNAVGYPVNITKINTAEAPSPKIELTFCEASMPLLPVVLIFVMFTG